VKRFILAYIHHGTLVDPLTLLKFYTCHLRVPNGGLFNFVTCPHFFFELLVWFGIAVASQQVGALGTAVGMSSYLTGRALATRKWYIAKMADYPRDRKAILPFLF